MVIVPVFEYIGPIIERHSDSQFKTSMLMYECMNKKGGTLIIQSNVTFQQPSEKGLCWQLGATPSYLAVLVRAQF
jgi:hypothetical protein